VRGRARIKCKSSEGKGKMCVGSCERIGKKLKEGKSSQVMSSEETQVKLDSSRVESSQAKLTRAEPSQVK
jgi:hypothetical protein